MVSRVIVSFEPRSVKRFLRGSGYNGWQRWWFSSTEYHASHTWSNKRHNGRVNSHCSSLSSKSLILFLAGGARSFLKQYLWFSVFQCLGSVSWNFHEALCCIAAVWLIVKVSIFCFTAHDSFCILWSRLQVFRFWLRRESCKRRKM